MSSHSVRPLAVVLASAFAVAACSGSGAITSEPDSADRPIASDATVDARNDRSGDVSTNGGGAAADGSQPLVELCRSDAPTSPSIEFTDAVDGFVPRHRPIAGPWTLRALLHERLGVDLDSLSAADRERMEKEVSERLSGGRVSDG